MKRVRGSFAGSEYFTYAGTIFAVVLFVTYLERLQLGAYGWMFARQMIAAAIATVVLAGLFLALAVSARARALARAPIVRGRLALSFELEQGAPAFTFRSWSVADIIRRFPWFAGATLLVVGGVVMALDHRFFTIVIAIAQTAVVVALIPRRRFGFRLCMFVLGSVTWALSAGLSYTHLSDWLTNFSSTEGLAVAALVLTMPLASAAMLSRDRALSAAPARKWGVTAVIAMAIFTAYALRTDHLLADWAPIHRSYFADVSQFVRDGHWVLWDVPSLYGFLSMVTLAVIPAPNSWQALYELTALFLVTEAMVVFIILQWRRTGWVNSAFAILFPLGTIFGAALPRYAWDGRLYPQGGLRFIWVVTLLFVAFLSFVWRRDCSRVRILKAVGYVIWLVAILWSFEAGVWATVVWIPYVISRALILRAASSAIVRLRAVLIACTPLVLLPLAAAAVITWIYRAALHVSPDWRGYVEFTSLFTSGKIRAIFWVQPYGAGWILLLVLVAVGALGIEAIRKRKWEVVPLLVATWCAVWGTSSYFAVEPLDFYVTLLFAVMSPAIAIVIFVSRDVLPASDTGFLARLSLLPIAIISIAVAVGEPARLAAASFPFAHGWTADVTQSMPSLPPELHGLLARAGVRRTDRVLFPEGPLWTELDQGLIMPFDRASNGRVFEYHAWLPMSPVGPRMLYDALDPARRKVYVNRFLQREKRAGWYVTYRSRPDCSELARSLVTTRTMWSPNFAIARCVVRRRTERP